MLSVALTTLILLLYISTKTSIIPLAFGYLFLLDKVTKKDETLILSLGLILSFLPFHTLPLQMAIIICLLIKRLKEEKTEIIPLIMGLGFTYS